MSGGHRRNRGWGREGRGRWNEPWTVALAGVVVWQTVPLPASH